MAKAMYLAALIDIVNVAQLMARAFGGAGKVHKQTSFSIFQEYRVIKNHILVQYALNITMLKIMIIYTLHNEETFFHDKM